MTSSTGGTIGQQGSMGAQAQSMQTGMGKGQRQTGTPDATFDLVSVLYHCLESATTCQQYVQDAQGDQELTQFFQQCVQYDKQTADKAKQLLAKRITMAGGH
jgi:hypothetical protein